MKELTIKGNDAGQRLDRFVGKAVPLLPESLLQKYIRLKRIKLNGKGAKRDTRLQLGDVLQLYINDEFFEKPREENSWLKVGTPKLDIVYEDVTYFWRIKNPAFSATVRAYGTITHLSPIFKRIWHRRANGGPRRKTPLLPLSATA